MPEAPALPQSPDELLERLFAIFPQYRAAYPGPVHDDAPTFHSVLLGFTPFFGASLGSFSERQLESFGALVSAAVEVCGALGNAFGTCLLEHLHQVRSILEVANAGLAAGHRSEEDIADLTRICEEMKSAADDPEQFAVKDSEFHRRLIQTTHNPLMSLLLNSIQTMTGEVRALVGKQPHLYERVMPTHVQILERVVAQDPDGARAAMREHLDIALTIQRELIQDQASN